MFVGHKTVGDIVNFLRATENFCLQSMQSRCIWRAHALLVLRAALLKQIGWHTKSFSTFPFFPDMTHWNKGLFFMRPALLGSISPKITVIECIENTLEWTCHSPLHYSLKICEETSS